MVIEELKPSKRVRDRWLAVLEDGSILRLSKNQIADFALYAGRELSDEEADRLTQAIENENFRAHALRMIMDTPRSRKEFVKRLEKINCPPEKAQEIAGWLEDLGYLDDAAYAREVAELYTRKGYGKRKIRDELYRRGVPRELWDEALEELPEAAGEIDVFLTGKLRGRTPDQREKKRLTDALLRRGFSWGDVKAAWSRQGQELPEI